MYTSFLGGIHLLSTDVLNIPCIMIIDRRLYNVAFLSFGMFGSASASGMDQVT